MPPIDHLDHSKYHSKRIIGILYFIRPKLPNTYSKVSVFSCGFCDNRLKSKYGGGDSISNSFHHLRLNYISDDKRKYDKSSLNDDGSIDIKIIIT